MSATFSPPAVKAALKAAAVELFGTATVCYGEPGSYVPNTVVSIGDQQFDLERPTMTTSRSREEVVRTEVTISVFVAGGEDAQQIATDDAYDLLLQLDNYLRTKPNEALGDACREAFVSDGALVEAKVKGKSGSGLAGRVSAVSVTVTSRHRRT